MIHVSLERQNENCVNIAALDNQHELLGLLMESDIDFVSDEWAREAGYFARFQAADGSFNFLDTFAIEGDCMVRYCYEPTYMLTALLMKTYMVNRERLEESYSQRFMDEAPLLEHMLGRAMEVCCKRGLNGVGFDAWKSRERAINYFMRCDVQQFIEEYPDICPRFTKMFQAFLTGNYEEFDAGMEGKVYYGNGIAISFL